MSDQPTSAEVEAPPNHVSIDRSSPHYFAHARKIGIQFDGRVTFDVVEYCVSEGWILKQLRDGRQRLLTERGRARTIKLQGVVTPYWR